MFIKLLPVIIAKVLYPIYFELGSQAFQRRWYFVLRYGRVGHCRLNKNIMKIKSSLKSIKKRDLNSKLVRRRGRVYIINKTNPKFKARQK